MFLWLKFNILFFFSFTMTLYFAIMKQEVSTMWNLFESSREKINVFRDAEFLPLAPKLEVQVNKIFQEESDFSAAKAKAMVFLLENVSLAADPDNVFAWKIDHQRVMGKMRHTLKNALRSTELNEKAKEYERCGAFLADADFGHIAPDWGYLLERGIPGVLEDLEKGGESAYYTERLAVYKAIGAFLERFADAARALQCEKGDFLAGNLRVLAVSPPKTMAQAMQLILILYVLQTRIDGVIIRTLGGLDRLLYPYFERDLRSGEFSREQIGEIICYFLQTISSMRVGSNLPFYLCGTNDEGEDATNELTFLILEQYRMLGLYDPKIHIMHHPKINSKVLRLAEEMIREGKNSIVFINTPLAAKALERIGIEPQDAKRVTVYGCYETSAEGCEIPCTCGGEINLPKAMELVMNGEESFADFTQFYQAVWQKLEDYTLSCMDAIASFEPHYHRICPSMILSPTFRASRESGTDIYSGGAKYNNTSIVGAGLATLVDGLLAVKKAVFEENLLTLQEFRAVLRSDWEADPRLRLLIQKKYPKFGNHHPEADALTMDLYNRFSALINGQKNGRGGVFRCGMFSVQWRYWMGEKCGATPDGRRKGEPISKNLAASLGQDKRGVTAYLQSLLALNGENCPDGYVADVVLHSSAVKGEEGLCAFHSLLQTFMEQGGFAIHFNVLDPNTLLEAQKEPEKYQNIQIRLCGWSVRFIDLEKSVQDEFILQSENRM